MDEKFQPTVAPMRFRLGAPEKGAIVVFFGVWLVFGGFLQSASDGLNWAMVLGLGIWGLSRGVSWIFTR